MLTFFTAVAEVGYKELMFQLRTAWLAPRRLPQPIRELFVGRARLTSIECGVLEACIDEELAKHKHTSGIPPPPTAQPPPELEPSHAA